MNISVIKIQNIKKEFIEGQDKIEILKDISVSFEQNKSYSIMGVSGTGKSTLLNILSGIDSPTSGTVYFNDIDINLLSQVEKEIFLNESIGLVFQDPCLIRELSIVENIMIKGLIKGDDYNLCKKKAVDLMKRVGLQDKVHSDVSLLSGGEQQRVAILRAIFNKPAFLLADEPTGSLDEHTGYEIMQFFLECQKLWNMGIIITTHNILIADLTQNIFKIHDGMLIKLK